MEKEGEGKDCEVKDDQEKAGSLVGEETQKEEKETEEDKFEDVQLVVVDKTADVEEVENNETVEEEPKTERKHKVSEGPGEGSESTSPLPSLIKTFKTLKSRKKKGGSHSHSPPNQVDDTMSWVEQAIDQADAEKTESKANGKDASGESEGEIKAEETEISESTTLGADVLDELENEFCMGLAQRINERNCEEHSEKNDAEEVGSAGMPSSTVSSLDAPSSPKSTHSNSRWYKRKPFFGENLTHEQALQMTVDRLRKQLEDMEEERDTLVSTIHTLEGRVEAQQAKIEALEYFFRQVNHRDENDRHQERRWEDTSSTSMSSGDSPEEEETPRDDTQEDDEAWELEDAPPKLSVSFKRTGQKMRSAKTRAAAKLATITFV